jgi:hypothetical protein
MSNLTDAAKAAKAEKREYHRQYREKNRKTIRERERLCWERQAVKHAGGKNTMNTREEKVATNSIKEKFLKSDPENVVFYKALKEKLQNLCQKEVFDVFSVHMPIYHDWDVTKEELEKIFKIANERAFDLVQEAYLEVTGERREL